MATTLGTDDVLKIAALARLELTADEVNTFTRQLGEILTYAGAIQRVDTAGVEPTSHPLPIDPSWRDDEPAPSLDRDTLLGAAPGASSRAGLFKVPKVL